MTKIGKNIKSNRTKLGITQEELAEKINVTRQAVSNWENGKTEPDIETLTKIAQIFDISIDELVDGIPKGITE
ncbi:MAG: helix-turn-helix transcriptional regulator [Oscillospiraceae bacterium]|nr:helix-turn-helix transcriptional regulator [Oscillospiraceae bacterium]